MTYKYGYECNKNKLYIDIVCVCRCIYHFHSICLLKVGKTSIFGHEKYCSRIYSVFITNNVELVNWKCDFYSFVFVSFISQSIWNIRSISPLYLSCFTFEVCVRMCVNVYWILFNAIPIAIVIAVPNRARRFVFFYPFSFCIFVFFSFSMAKFLLVSPNVLIRCVSSEQFYIVRVYKKNIAWMEGEVGWRMKMMRIWIRLNLLGWMVNGFSYVQKWTWKHSLFTVFIWIFLHPLTHHLMSKESEWKWVCVATFLLLNV